MAATKSVILSAVVCLAAVICSCEGMGIHTQPSLAVLVGDMVKKLTSASPSCDPSLANPCGCCCGKNDGVQMSDCHIAASFMVSSGQCPDFLPYSTSSSCTNPTPYSEAGCVSGTSVEDLVNLCHLEGRNCDHSKEEACGCLNEYIGSCFLVNNTSPDLFKEPCALPRARALHHVTALCPNLTSVAVQGCVKPPIRQGMAVKDDCSASTAVGGTCQMTCAEGYVPSPTSTSKIDLTCTSAGFVISGGNMDCIEVPGCDSSSFLSLGDNVRGVVTDCPKRTPLGSHCMMACAEGYVSLADRRVEANCQQSADGVVAFSPTVTCVSSICSTSVIPSGVVHDCGVNSSIIGSTCTLKCPPGYVGNSVQAVCVGHGGLATVPYAEYSFADVVCNYVGLDAPQITKLTLSVVLSYGSMLLDTQPPFHSGLTNATLSLPYRYSVIRLVSTTSGSLSYLCSNCTSTTTDGTFGLSVGSQNISIIVTSPSDRNIVRTFLLQVTREADDTPPASLATQSAQNGTVANATTPTATNNATTALNGTLASGNITANNNTDFVDRSKVWLQSTLRLDLIFTSDFQTRYQAPVTAVIADKLGLTSNDFISIAFSSGSVIVNFVIKADPQLKATLEGRFDQIVADDSLRASLCLAAGVCSVSPVVIVSAFHSVPLPTPTPTPTPSRSQQQLVPMRDGFRQTLPVIHSPPVTARRSLPGIAARRFQEQLVREENFKLSVVQSLCPNISLQIRQANAMSFFERCQRERDEMQHIVEEAKRYAAQIARQSRQHTQHTTHQTTISPSDNLQNTQQRQVALVKLRWMGNASQVEVRFEMDGWHTPHFMTRTPFAATWELIIALPAETRVAFKFIVDGEWQTHASYPTCQDGSGNTNNVVVPVRIEWRHSVTHEQPQPEVAVCSQLDGWNSRVLLEAVPSNDDSSESVCCVGLVLPGNWVSFQFKFIVDGTWTTSSLYPVLHDGSFENNAIFIGP
eukprot:c9772_g1_i1.p1 GENE.c9772_g1_i1~~c9772_g1_i1.p1  ORF type:complete len:1001 (-),score=286.51 c9772_g1_i1:1060-3981(-)